MGGRTRGHWLISILGENVGLYLTIFEMLFLHDILFVNDFAQEIKFVFGQLEKTALIINKQFAFLQRGIILQLVPMNEGNLTPFSKDGSRLNFVSVKQMTELKPRIRAKRKAFPRNKSEIQIGS